MDAWNMWHTIAGKHLQVHKPNIKVDGQKVENPEYVKDDDGEMRLRFGNVLREMCYGEAPFLPLGQCREGNALRPRTHNERV